MSEMPMMWIAYDLSIHDPNKNREQFNGQKPAWGETVEQFLENRGVPVPQTGDSLSLRMGYRKVMSRRLQRPECDENGAPVTGWYWTIFVE